MKWKKKKNFQKQRQTGTFGHRSENLSKMKRQTQVFNKTSSWWWNETLVRFIKRRSNFWTQLSLFTRHHNPLLWRHLRGQFRPWWSWVDDDQNQEAGSPRWCHFLHFLHVGLMVPDRSSGPASAGILLLAQRSCCSVSHWSYVLLSVIIYF